MSSKKTTARPKTPTATPGGPGSIGYVYRPAPRPATGATGHASAAVPLPVHESESSSAAAKHIARAKVKAAAEYAARHAPAATTDAASKNPSPALGPKPAPPTTAAAATVVAASHSNSAAEGHAHTESVSGIRSTIRSAVQQQQQHAHGSSVTRDLASKGGPTSGKDPVSAAVSRAPSAESSRNYAPHGQQLDFDGVGFGGGGGGEFDDPPSDSFDLPKGEWTPDELIMMRMVNADGSDRPSARKTTVAGSSETTTPLPAVRSYLQVASPPPPTTDSSSGVPTSSAGSSRKNSSSTNAQRPTNIVKEDPAQQQHQKQQPQQQRPVSGIADVRRKSFTTTASQFSHIAMLALQQVRTGKKTAPSSPHLKATPAPSATTAGHLPPNGPADSYKKALRLEVQRLLVTRGIDATDAEAGFDAMPEAVTNLAARGMHPPQPTAQQQQQQQPPATPAAAVPAASSSTPAPIPAPIVTASASAAATSDTAKTPASTAGASPWSSIAAAAISGVRVQKGESIVGQKATPPTPKTPAVELQVDSAVAASSSGGLPVMVLGSTSHSSATPSQSSRSLTSPFAASPISSAGGGGGGGRWDSLAAAAISHVRAKTKELQVAAGEPEESPFARSTATSPKNNGKDVAVWATSGLATNTTASSSSSSSVKLPSSNSSAVLLSAQHLVVRNTPLPPLAPGTVLVEMKAVGICGSDVHYLTHGAIGDFVLRSPMVVGHESAGRVVALGPGVGAGSGLRVGDRVAIEPGVSCGVCAPCKAGRSNLCPGLKFHSTPPVHGSLSNHIVHPAHLCHKLPDHVSYAAGALCEPLSIAIYACRRAQMQLGDSVLIMGAGPIGLLCAMVARAQGARRITIVDVSEARVKLAKEVLRTDGDAGNGAAHSAAAAASSWSSAVVQFVHTPMDMSHEEAVKKIRAAATSPCEEHGDILADESTGGVDLAFECSGAESATRTALVSIRSGGCLLLIGLGGASTLTLPLQTEVVTREVDVRGIFRYANCYPAAVSMVACAQIPVERIVTHRYQLRKPTTHDEKKAAMPITTSTAASSSPAVGASPSLSPSTASAVPDLGALVQEQLLAGFETAKTGKGADGRDTIKVMFAL